MISKYESIESNALQELNNWAIKTWNITVNHSPLEAQKFNLKAKNLHSYFIPTVQCANLLPVSSAPANIANISTNREGSPFHRVSANFSTKVTNFLRQTLPPCRLRWTYPRSFTDATSQSPPLGLRLWLEVVDSRLTLLAAASWASSELSSRYVSWPAAALDRGRKRRGCCEEYNRTQSGLATINCKWHRSAFDKICHCYS